jgi:hypothetical protein
MDLACARMESQVCRQPDVCLSRHVMVPLLRATRVMACHLLVKTSVFWKPLSRELWGLTRLQGAVHGPHVRLDQEPVG